MCLLPAWRQKRWTSVMKSQPDVWAHIYPPPPQLKTQNNHQKKWQKHLLLHPFTSFLPFAFSSQPISGLLADITWKLRVWLSQKRCKGWDTKAKKKKKQKNWHEREIWTKRLRWNSKSEREKKKRWRKNAASWRRKGEVHNVPSWPQEALRSAWWINNHT